VIVVGSEIVEDIVEFGPGQIGFGNFRSGFELVHDVADFRPVRMFSGQKVEDGVLTFRVERPAVAVISPNLL
jgi:hypothetical protein